MRNEYTPREDSGALFINTKKVAGSKQPDYQGDLALSADLVKHLQATLTAGKVPTLRLAGWKRVSKGGTAWLSLQPAKPYVPGQQAYAPKGTTKPPVGFDEDKDGIPF
jgi:hypothetical protein